MKTVGACLAGLIAAAALAPAAGVEQAARAQTPVYDESPIQYSTTQPHDPVARLQRRLASGQATLKRTADHGYLQSLLQELKIAPSSQMLVFSKTSFQRERISPENPRAIYFDDDTYVGYVPGGDDLEIATTDPALGTIFYTIDQRVGSDAGAAAASVKLVRQTESCLQCHAGSMTRDIPGLLVRSTFCDAAGMPILSAGTFLTTHESPMEQRWGGWYVGGPGDREPTVKTMGNALFAERDGGQAAPLRRAELKDFSRYLEPQSDPVALLVLAHQAEAHNRFTHAVYATRRALRDEKILNDALGETPKPGTHSDSTRSRVKSACEPLLEYLLFSGETPIGDAASADSSPFARDFAARGPKDSHGRSLRDFDLKSRLFRYPCSYLIYSDSFDQLPDMARDYLLRRLWDVLNGTDTSKPFANVSAADRRDILGILRETKPNLPSYWAGK